MTQEEMETKIITLFQLHGMNAQANVYINYALNRAKRRACMARLQRLCPHLFVRTYSKIHHVTGTQLGWCRWCGATVERYPLVAGAARDPHSAWQVFTDKIMDVFARYRPAALTHADAVGEVLAMYEEGVPTFGCSKAGKTFLQNAM
jgi:hypothetical protein